MPESHSGLPEALLHPDFRCAAASEVDFNLRQGSQESGGDCLHLAEVLDSADLYSAALHAWQRVLAVYPAMERAHARVAQLLLKAGDVHGAEIAAEHGLEVVPNSAALRLIASEAIAKEGREYDARRILLEGLAGVDGSGAAGEELLGRLATMQDAHGEGAAEIYARLADSPLMTPDKRHDALERGLEVALRDDDIEHARRFAGLLEAEGHPEFERVTLREPSHASMAMIPGGRDALFNALSEAAQAMRDQPGKKAMVVFTDGDDNASILNSDAAVNRARVDGVPLFTVAEGEALECPGLKKILLNLSASTGGAAFDVDDEKSMDAIFQRISGQLHHMYLLAYTPAIGPEEKDWRRIDVQVERVQDARVRAKAGYFP